MTLDQRLNYQQAWTYEHIHILRFKVYFFNDSWDSGFGNFTITEVLGRLYSFGMFKGYATLGHAYNLTKLHKVPVHLADHFPVDPYFDSLVCSTSLL